MTRIFLSGFLLLAMCGIGLTQQTDQNQIQAQEKAQIDAARTGAGCGPSEIQFDVKMDKKQHPSAQPQPEKALVYIFEDETRQPNVFVFGSVTTRVGVDGKWVGANRGQSYFFFPLDPGEHRLCVEWQSSFKRLSQLGFATNFTVEKGKTYYFRTEVEEREKFPAGVKLEPVDSAEGQFLISGGALSIFKIKPPEPPAEPYNPI